MTGPRSDPGFRDGVGGVIQPDNHEVPGVHQGHGVVKTIVAVAAGEPYQQWHGVVGTVTRGNPDAHAQGFVRAGFPELGKGDVDFGIGLHPRIGRVDEGGAQQGGFFARDSGDGRSCGVRLRVGCERWSCGRRGGGDSRGLQAADIVPIGRGKFIDRTW